MELYVLNMLLPVTYICQYAFTVADIAKSGTFVKLGFPNESGRKTADII